MNKLMPILVVSIFLILLACGKAYNDYHQPHTGDVWAYVQGVERKRINPFGPPPAAFLEINTVLCVSNGFVKFKCQRFVADGELAYTDSASVRMFLVGSKLISRK